MKERKSGNPQAPIRHPDNGRPLSTADTTCFNKIYAGMMRSPEIGRSRIAQAGEIPSFLDETPLPDEAKNAYRLPLAPEVLKYTKE